MKAKPRVLAVDIGGTNVKMLATGEAEPRKFASGKDLTPRKMVAGVMKLAGNWKYNVVSIGYPGQVVGDGAVTEPRNLAHGWVGFDFAAAFGRPVKVINDAATAGPRELRGWNDAFPRPRDGSRLRTDGAWTHRADGARGSVLQEADHRGLLRNSRAPEARKREVAQGRRVLGETAQVRASP